MYVAQYLLVFLVIVTQWVGTFCLAVKCCNRLVFGCARVWRFPSHLYCPFQEITSYSAEVGLSRSSTERP